MRNYISSEFKLGILGGGQLGRMLIQSAASFDIDISILDPNPQAPSAPYAHNFVLGDFRDYDSVLAFGKTVDLITVEIEDVNTDALRALVDLGKTVNPHPDVLDLIRDKGTQKSFYAEHQLPTAPFYLVANAEEAKNLLSEGKITLPFVQKMRTGGYDGKGVSIIRTEQDLTEKWLPGPSLVEQLADIKKELAIIVAGSDASDDNLCFPPVEMLFDPEANLVEFLASPASIPTEVENECRTIARNLYKDLNMRGLLAVELFWNKDGSIWINEVAPRPHNSGHHSIEGNITSQFEQHLRSVLNSPLGDTSIIKPAVMINLLGAPEASGSVDYVGLDKVLAKKGVYPHVYGKKQVSPFRKMGHITCISDKIEDAISLGKWVKETVVVNGK